MAMRAELQKCKEQTYPSRNPPDLATKGGSVQDLSDEQDNDEDSVNPTDNIEKMMSQEEMTQTCPSCGRGDEFV
eukprot:524527-Ditylum_brightwellii.AAC.1